MRPKSLILLALALGCGLVASLGINQVMSQGTPVAAPKGDSEAIFVALKDININDQITPDMVKLEQWPKDKIPQDALRKLEDVKDRRAKQRLFKDEPLVDRKLHPAGEAGARPTDHIPNGYRVAAVKVEASTTGGNLVKPGDRVDLILHVQKNLSANIAETSALTFLQDVKVFAVNSTIKDEEGGGAISARTVSLLLKPDEVEKVTLAANMGRIALSLRPPQDDVMVASSGTDTRRFFSGNGDSSERTEEGAKPASEPEPKVAQPAPAQDNPLQNFLQSLTSQAAKSKMGQEFAKQESPNYRMQIMDGRGAVQVYEIGLGGEEPKPVNGGSASAPSPKDFISSLHLDEDDASLLDKTIDKNEQQH